MNRQKGMTLIGMLFTAASVIVIGLVLMRVVPVYIENYQVKSALSALQDMDKDRLSTDMQANMFALKKRFASQMTIDGLDNEITAKNITVKPQGEGRISIEVKYTAIRPLFGNISLMFKFNEVKEVTIDKS